MPDKNGNPVNPENKVDLNDLDSLTREELRWAADRSLLTADQIRQYGLDRPHDPSAPVMPEEEKGDVDTTAYHGVQTPSGPTMNVVGSDSDALRREEDGERVVESYDELSLSELKDEIDARNEVKADGEKISKSGSKSDLVARLEADDEESDEG